MLSIILPTYNEAKNIPILLERLAKVLKNTAYEVIVVDDDSPDHTWEVAAGLQKSYPLKVLRRVGRRGLSSAVTEGFNLANGDVLLVMDSDLQHDPQLVLSLSKAVEDGADIAVASRYMKGGSVGEWVKGRRILSTVATFLARKLPPVEVSDPMSGFFALRASTYRAIAKDLRPTGFKILLEILAFLPRGTKTAEVPLVFRMREHGQSKLSWKVELQFLWQLVRILFHRIQRVLLWVIVCIALLALTPRAWALRLLYTDGAIRTQVQTALQRTADEHGWLLSDLSVTHVSDDHMRVVLTEHTRGTDPHECMDIFYEPYRLQPCEE